MSNLKCNYYPNVDADLYIRTGFRISRKLILWIYESHLFRKVYVDNCLICDKHQLDDGVGKNSVQFIQSLRSLPLFLRQIGNFILDFVSIQRLQSIIRSNHNNSNYTHLFVGTFGLSVPFIAKLILKMGSPLIISVVEEGTVNYLLSVEDLCVEYVKQGWGSYYSWLSILFRIDKAFCLKMAKSVSAVYLYSPESYRHDDNVVLCHLPQITHDNPVRSLCTVEVDSAILAEYHDRKWCYVLQDSSPRLGELIETILNILGSSNVVFREHPWFSVLRTLSPPINMGGAYVDNNSSKFTFESLFSEINSNNFALITTDSSATMIPKYMYNKEPFVIYLYHISQNRSDDAISSTDLMIASFIDLYSDNSKIYVPKSMDELVHALKEISIKLK